MCSCFLICYRQKSLFLNFSCYLKCLGITDQVLSSESEYGLVGRRKKRRGPMTFDQVLYKWISNQAEISCNFNLVENSIQKPNSFLYKISKFEIVTNFIWQQKQCIFYLLPPVKNGLLVKPQHFSIFKFHSIFFSLRKKRKV